MQGEGENEKQVQSRQLYNRKNKFFTAKSFADVVGEIHDRSERERLLGEIERVKGLYNSLSETYQKGKEAGAESSSVWK